MAGGAAKYGPNSTAAQAEKNLARLKETAARGAFPVATDAKQVVAHPMGSKNPLMSPQSGKQFLDRKQQEAELKKVGDI